MRIASLNDIITTARSGLRRHIHGSLLAALFVAEAIFFYAHVARHVAPFYPPHYDQLSYYLATYDLIGAFHARGLGAFVDELLQPNSATGTTFVLQGALLSLIGGANRTAILSVNLLYLLALQLSLYVVVRARTGRTDVAWIAMALLLALATIFNGAGGLYDYRIDFSALCLYGIWVCLILWSRVFRYTGRSLVVAIVGIMLVYSRYFTIIYIAGVLFGLLAISVYSVWRNPSIYRKAVAAKRARNILLSGSVVALICLLRLFLSRDAIYGYYVMGHVLGEEKFIRAHEVGLYSLASHLIFYPKSILKHVGAVTLLMAGALAAWSQCRDRASTTNAWTRLRRYRREFATLALAVLFPVAILTLNVAKSPVVGGIVAVPIVLAMVLFGAAVWPQSRSALRRMPGRAKLLPTLAMAIAFAVFAARGLWSRDLPPAPNLDRITLLTKTIATYAMETGVSRLSLSTDRVEDYQNAFTVKLFSIESLPRNLEIEPLFGQGAYGIFATSREDALRLFAESDVIVLTDPATGRSQPYPINTKIKEYWDELWQWTNENRLLLFSTEILGIPYRVFVRPPPKEHPLGRASTDGARPR
jgi:hypothetical protein